MALRDPPRSHRDLHVQWADAAEAGGGVFFHQLSVAHDELDSSKGQAWLSPPSSKVSEARPEPPILQHAMPTSPDESRCCHKTFNNNEHSEEKLEWRNDANNSPPSCSSSGSAFSGTYSSDDDDITERGRDDFRDREAAATAMKEQGLISGDGDDALVVAPVHASSSLHSQGPSPLKFIDEQGSTASSSDHTAVPDREACTLKGRLRQHLPWSPSLSPELSSADFLFPHPVGGRSGNSDTCALETDHSPPNVAVCSSTNSDSSCASSPQYQYHSSTAVHQPRARCGCRGLTVRVDSGPLGISLEASYRMEQGFVLKQAWSDCAADSGMFTHSVHVQNLPGKRDDGHIGALDLGLEGKSSSSGLIKVRSVGLEGGGGITKSGVLVRPPLPVPPGITSTKEAVSSALVGVLEVEQGDILVRVDDVQVYPNICSSAAAVWDIMLLCRFRGLVSFWWQPIYSHRA